MNINILRYFLFGIAGGQEADHAFVEVPRVLALLYKFLIIAI